MNDATTLQSGHQIAIGTSNGGLPAVTTALPSGSVSGQYTDPAIVQLANEHAALTAAAADTTGEAVATVAGNRESLLQAIGAHLESAWAAGKADFIASIGAINSLIANHATTAGLSQAAPTIDPLPNLKGDLTGLEAQANADRTLQGGGSGI